MFERYDPALGSARSFLRQTRARPTHITFPRNRRAFASERRRDQNELLVG